jgi:oligopeptide/dipeptide ABC transporter ATP-binding protein
VSSQLVGSGPPIKPLVEVEDLRKFFPIHKGFFGRHVGDVKAVDGVSFTIYPKETLGLVGESGCGKTTVGRTLLRLLEPTSGAARFDGKDLFALEREELRATRRDMQIIFQDPYSSLNPRMTVGSIIGDALDLHGIARGEQRFERAKELLERVGLQASYVDRYPHEFSGGQRQRIGIARAIALNPRFIVCDEAVSALDVSVQAQILNLLKDLQQEYGLSYMFIAHDLSVVRHIADRVAVMYLGRIVETSVCDDLYEAPLHPYTQALLSAIPHPEPGRKRERIILEGDVPSPIDPPDGCHFHTRCPLAFDRCRQDVPEMREARDGHRVACHLYEDAEYPAEPIAIGSDRPAAAGSGKAADESPEWDQSLEFDMFDGTESGDGARSMGIPEVLRDRAGMALGPFGEIVDPEDTFLKTAEIPSLDAIVSGAAPSVADVPAPRIEGSLLTASGDEDEDEEVATQLEMPILDDELPADVTADATSDATDDGLTADLEPVSDMGIDTLEPPDDATDEVATVDPAADAVADDVPGPHELAPRGPLPRVSPRLPPDERPTLDSPLPPLEAEETVLDGPKEPSLDEEPTVQAIPPAGAPSSVEESGVMPPIHDEDGIPDDVSLHGDEIRPLDLELALRRDLDEDTLEIAPLVEDPTDDLPPPHPDDDE